MQTSDRFPTATVHQARLCIFQPTRRPRVLKNPLIETKFGLIRVRKGQLGQQHADVLEAILRYAERHVELEDGRYKLLVDPAVIRRVARQPSGSTYERVLDELMAAVIEIIEPKHLACVGHLIAHIEDAVRADGTPITKPNPLGGKRNLKRVEIGKAASRLLQSDLLLRYDPAPIAELRHGVSQAVARYVIGHSVTPNGGWHLDTVIKAVCGQLLSGQQIRDYRRYLHEEANALYTIGVYVDGNRIRRVGHKPGIRTGAWRPVGHKPGGVGQKPVKTRKRGTKARPFRNHQVPLQVADG